MLAVQVEIHFVFIVRKYTIRQQALQQPVRLLLLVAPLHANQRKNPFFDATHEFSINMNSSFGYSLQ